MDCIELIRALLKKEEGFVPYAYVDSLGFLTIGYGKLIDKRGGGITEKEAEMLLDNEILDKIQQLNEKLPWWSTLDQVRRTVVLAMAFQLGIDGLLGFKNTLELLRNGKWSEASAQMLESKWAEQTPARAKRMADAIRSGRLIL